MNIYPFSKGVPKWYAVDIAVPVSSTNSGVINLDANYPFLLQEWGAVSDKDTKTNQYNDTFTIGITIQTPGAVQLYNNQVHAAQFWNPKNAGMSLAPRLVLPASSIISIALTDLNASGTNTVTFAMRGWNIKDLAYFGINQADLRM